VHNEWLLAFDVFDEGSSNWIQLFINSADNTRAKNLLSRALTQVIDFSPVSLTQGKISNSALEPTTPVVKLRKCDEFVTDVTYTGKTIMVKGNEK